MTGFHEKKLGDVLTFQRGFDITKQEQSPGDIPIISSSGITSQHNQFKVKGPGVIIGRKGSLGTVHYNASNFWPHDTTLWVKDFKGNNPRFIYYFLQLLHFENFDTGSSNPTLNRNHIHKIKVIFPDRTIQDKIAAILSAYDDLIENNKRRIALLEKMAEEIYREWFVRFRFPGYQATEFEKGIPKDWEQTSLVDLGTYLNGFAFAPEHWGVDGIPIIKIREMTSGLGADTPRNTGEEIDSKYHFSDGEIIFSWSATLMIKIWSQGNGLINQHLFKVTPKKGIPRDFLYFSIKFSLPVFESLTTGSTMKHIKRKELSMVKIPLASGVLLNSFNKLVHPMIEQSLSLAKQNEVLIETKNNLLPRLISGKLSVEHLNIQFPPSMLNTKIEES